MECIDRFLWKKNWDTFRYIFIPMINLDTLLANNMEFFESTVETCILHFDWLEMAWHQAQTSIMTLMQLSRNVME